MNKDWDDPNRPLPVPLGGGVDEIIAQLHKQIHDNNNAFQIKYSTLEVRAAQLKTALTKVLDFEWNAWTEAKALLEKLNARDNQD